MTQHQYDLLFRHKCQAFKNMIAAADEYNLHRDEHRLAKHKTACNALRKAERDLDAARKLLESR